MNYGMSPLLGITIDGAGIPDLLGSLRGRIVWRRLRNMSLLRRQGNYGEERTMLSNIHTRRRRASVLREKKNTIQGTLQVSASSAETG